MPAMITMWRGSRPTCCAASSTLRLSPRELTETSMASVDVVSIRKSFGNLEVLHGVDVAIADGEFIVLVGPSGCGKSTLLRMIAGLEEVSQGTIAIGGAGGEGVRARARGSAHVVHRPSPL